MINDFLLNLLSEAIGIVVTVFIVDRLLKRREERLWLSSKHLAHHKLFEIFDGFLLKDLGVTPVEDPMWFYFGTVKILGSGAFSNYNEAQIRSIIKRIPLIDCDVHRYNSVEPYLEIKKDVEGVLHTSARILGPDLTALLVSFNNSVSTFVQASLFIADPDFQALRQIWIDIGVHAFNIRLYLEKSADRCKTLKEDLNLSIGKLERASAIKC